AGRVAFFLASLRSLVAGQFISSNADVLINKLNFDAIRQSEIGRLSTSLGEIVAKVVGVAPPQVSDVNGSPGMVTLNSGTSRNAWMPDDFPSSGTGTLLSCKIELPEATAFLAQSALNSVDFASDVRSAVAQIFGSASNAVVGTISVEAASVAQKYVPPVQTQTEAVPGAAGADQIIAKLGAGGMDLTTIGEIAICTLAAVFFIVRCAYQQMCGARQQAGFLEVNRYEQDVPIYDNPMKMFQRNPPGYTGH
ncbi:unnamed protein product, partial [Polarella glacialis]